MNNLNVQAARSATPGAIPMIRHSLALAALAALCACSAKVNNLPGQCSTTADCAAGQVCDSTTGIGVCAAGCGDTVCTSDQVCANNVCIAATCVPACITSTGQTCEMHDGGFTCVQTSCFPTCDPSYQECNTQANPPACVNTTCHPACASNELCSSADGGFTCIPLTTGQIQITAPDAGTISGILTPLSVAASAGAPGGGPTQVQLAVQQGVHSASVEVAVGNNGIYTGNVVLADAGFSTGNANVVGTVFWVLDGGELDASSPAVAIQIDADPPAFGVPSTDAGFYSGVATPAQTVTLSLPINDQGPSGVNPSTVTLAVGAHQIPANSAAYPAGGNGTYTFNFPASDLSTSGTFVGAVPYVVSATDKVGNASAFDGGAIAVDNVAPAITAITYDAGTWFGGDAGITISANVQDQVNGSGLNASTVALALSGGASVTGASPVGNVYSFTTTGAALQVAGQQGPVPFGITAADNADNLASVDGGAILVDEQAPGVAATSVANGTAIADGGWYAQSGGNIKVTTLINDGSGSGPASAELQVGSTEPLTSSVGSAVAGGTNYTFTIPTSVQTTGVETPIALQAAGTDAVGNAGALAAATSGTGAPVSLLIDGKGPQITSVSITTAPDATIGGVKWFNQNTGAPELTATATIIDSGSGLNAASVALQTSTGSPLVGGTAAGNNVFTFPIPRSSGLSTLIASGAQATLSLRITATDNVGNTSTAAIPTFGIDGQKPTVSFSMTGQYPASGAGCDSSAPSGIAASTSILCGHDGQRFTRNGDDGATLVYTASDGSGGSGTSATGPTCTVPGQSTCTAAYSTTNSNYAFTINPSQATFSSDADGRGSVSVTVTAQDAVGNAGTASATVNITRLKWIRSLPGAFGPLKAPAVLTPAISGSRFLLVAGGSGSSAAIASLDTSGGLLTSTTVGATGAANPELAYSPATETLYVTQEGAQNMAAFTASSAGFAASYTCNLGTGGQITGAPALIPGATEYAIVADSNSHKLIALSGGSAGCISLLNAPSVAAGNETISSPTTDGTNVYAVYETTGLAKVSFTGGSFVSTPVLQNESFNAPLGGAAIAGGNLFLADFKTYDEFTTNFTGTVTDLWTGTGAGKMADTIAFGPVVNGALVYGAAGPNGSGVMRVFNSSDGSVAFSLSTSQSNSAVAIGAESTPVIYFTDSGGTLHARVRTSSSASTTSIAPGWTAEFTGATTSATFTGLTNEPTLGADGTLYFGTQSGQVFAIATDSPGAVTPGSSNWPRVAFDNCNSANSSLTNCQ